MIVLSLTNGEWQEMGLGQVPGPLKFGLWPRCSKISRILSRLDLFPISGNWTRILCGSEGWPFLSFGTLLEHLNTSLVMFIMMLQWISKRSQKSFVTNVEAI